MASIAMAAVARRGRHRGAKSGGRPFHRRLRGGQHEVFERLSDEKRTTGCESHRWLRRRGWHVAQGDVAPQQSAIRLAAEAPLVVYRIVGALLDIVEAKPTCALTSPLGVMPSGNTTVPEIGYGRPG